jgi:hypothetical protein
LESSIRTRSQKVRRSFPDPSSSRRGQGPVITHELSVTTTLAVQAWCESFAWPTSGIINRRNYSSFYVSGVANTLFNISFAGIKDDGELVTRTTHSARAHKAHAGSLESFFHQALNTKSCVFWALGSSSGGRGLQFDFLYTVSPSPLAVVLLCISE